MMFCFTPFAMITTFIDARHAFADAAIHAIFTMPCFAVSIFSAAAIFAALAY